MEETTVSIAPYGWLQSIMSCKWILIYSEYINVPECIWWKTSFQKDFLHTHLDENALDKNEPKHGFFFIDNWGFCLQPVIICTS